MALPEFHSHAADIAASLREQIAEAEDQLDCLVWRSAH